MKSYLILPLLLIAACSHLFGQQKTSIQQQKNELRTFEKYLSSLKQNLSYNDKASITLDEQALVSIIRHEIDESYALSASLPTVEKEQSNQRLAQMQSVLHGLDNFSFDVAKPNERADKLRLLDSFVGLMQADLEQFKSLFVAESTEEQQLEARKKKKG